MKKCLAIILVIIPILTWAETDQSSIPNPKETNGHTYVSNPDGIIKASTVAILNNSLDSLERTTKTEIAVVLVQSIGENTVDDFAVSLFKKWKIGKAKADNGLLILFVQDQKKIKFETGYGLEGALPDAICKRIQMEYMIPSFKNGDIDKGMLDGVNMAISFLRKEPVIEVKSDPIHWNEILPIACGAYLILALICFIWLNNVILNTQKNERFTTNIERFQAIKTQKTAIISTFAIGSTILSVVLILLFASPLYLVLAIFVPITAVPANLYGLAAMTKIRRKPIPCQSCGKMMHLLTEKEEDAHLKLAQQFEEQLHSIDYDVFVCDSCKNEAIYTLDKPSQYSPCPKCNTKAFILDEKRMTVSPTYFSAGNVRLTYRCKYCGFEQHDNQKIDRLTRNGSAVVGGAVGGSIFSGGGGFSNNDSGFGGGSFGGGESGGGGASSGW